VNASSIKELGSSFASALLIKVNFRAGCNYIKARFFSSVLEDSFGIKTCTNSALNNVLSAI